MNTPHRRVLVLGDDSRSCLTVVRSLGRRGIEVVLGFQDHESIVPWSRYVTRAVALPPTDSQMNAWLDAIQTLIRREPVDLLIPTSDRALVPLAHHRAIFESLARVAMPDDHAFACSYLKHNTFAMADELGVPAPRSLRVESPADLDQVITAGLGLPLIVKPSSSRVCHQGRLISLEVKLARDLNSLRRYVLDLLPVTPVLVQVFSPGIGVGQEFLADHGEIVSAFQHERVHEPLGGGGSSYRRSVPLDERMLDHSRAMLRYMRWTGVAMIEYKRDPGSGRYALMEINGRFWGSLPLAVAAGVDFPYQLYELLVLRRRPERQDYRRGIYCRNLFQDLSWMRQNLHADRSDPFVISVPPARVLGEVYNIVRGREHWDTFALDDPRPGLADAVAETKVLLSRLMTRARRTAGDRVQRRLSSMNSWRHWQRARLQRLLASGPRVLFICKGNICRSPFAEAYARRSLAEHGGQGPEVASAGYYSKSGRRSPVEAQQAAREFGVDLEPHRSRTLSNDLVDWAGAIFCMDLANHEEVSRAFPQARDRLLLLRPFAKQASGASISDPWGHPLDQFQDCYRIIASSVDGVMATILPESHAVD